MHFSLLQDAADFEWVMWFTTFRNHILFALVGHVIFAKIFSLVAPKVRGCECSWVLNKYTYRLMVLFSVNMYEIHICVCVCAQV